VQQGRDIKLYEIQQALQGGFVRLRWTS